MSAPGETMPTYDIETIPNPLAPGPLHQLLSRSGRARHHTKRALVAARQAYQQENGLTFPEASRALGMTTPELQLVERGKVAPDDDTLALYEAMGVDLEALYVSAKTAIRMDREQKRQRLEALDADLMAADIAAHQTGLIARSHY